MAQSIESPTSPASRLVAVCAGLPHLAQLMSLATALMATTLPVAAQRPAAELIRVGDPVRARLGAADPKRADGAHYRLYRYYGVRGEEVTITLRSSDFDAFLVVGRATSSGDTNPDNLANRTIDDDGGGGTDSRVVYTFPRDGEYLIVATSYDAGATGAYALEIGTAGGGSSPASTPLSTRIPAGLRRVTLGTAMAGQLREGSLKRNQRYYDTYWYEAASGERVVITMRSRQFDTFLEMGGPILATPTANLDFDVIASDDDGGGGTDSQIAFTFKEAGVYAIRARPFDAETEGTYSLALFQPGSAEPTLPLAAQTSRPPAPASTNATPPAPRPAPTPRPAPQPDRRWTLDEAVAEATQHYRANGYTIWVSQREERVFRTEAMEFDMATVRGRIYEIRVLEEDAIGAAQIQLDLLTMRYREWVVAEGGGQGILGSASAESPRGILRTGATFRVPGSGNFNITNTRLRFTIRAGGNQGYYGKNVHVFIVTPP